MLEKSVLVFVVFGTLQLAAVSAVWLCSADEDCSLLAGGVCRAGDCVCPPGRQSVLGGSVCADLAPYHTSACLETHQCSRMSVLYECRRDNATDEQGNCLCQPDHHYFLGRCWRTLGFGEPCARSEECLAPIRNPYSLACNATCQCAAGFYERQRGECREIASAVGDGCVLDSDCQFEGGACDQSNLSCFDINAEEPEPSKVVKMSAANKMAENQTAPTSRQHGVECGVNNPCAESFECSPFGVCICPVGYYSDGDGTICYAELGSPSTEEQCVGLLAVVRSGVCSCPPNFFFDDNMRDCVRVTRQLAQSCVSDANCFTFGSAARCGPARGPWGLRACACAPDLAVWDAARQMCRLFAGIGESCEVDSDCLAGELEIQCRVDEQGEGYCACPDGFVAAGGLCLTLGLELGDACQVSQECTGTANTVCDEGRCACDSEGYREVDGVCAPIIGGVCTADSDCLVDNTQCLTAGNATTCQCAAGYVAHEDECWPTVTDIAAPCNVSAQCQAALGPASQCAGGACACAAGHHHRDAGCWPSTGLFEACSRSSQCFLAGLSERVVCRNSQCQCEFHYPYSEQLRTCTSSATTLASSIILVIATIMHL